MITDAELTAMYGRGLHPDTTARVIDEVRRLKAALDRNADQYMETQNAAWEWQGRAEAAEARLAAVAALCDAAAPPNQCLYADEGVDCESHCDCGWGDIWHERLRATLEGKEWP